MIRSNVSNNNNVDQGHNNGLVAYRPRLNSQQSNYNDRAIIDGKLSSQIGLGLINENGDQNNMSDNSDYDNMCAPV